MIKKILFIFPLLFVDFLAFSAAAPFFPHFFLPHSYTFFPGQMTNAYSYILLGIFGALYPAAQLIGAPLLGHISDKIGRKKILMLCYLGNMAGYSLCGYGVLVRQITPLFLGTFISGITGVNLSITNALIAKHSDASNRAQLFAFSNLSIGMGYILGPKLSQKILLSQHDFFHSAMTVLVCCTFAALLSMVFIYYLCPEEDDDKKRLSNFPALSFHHLTQCSKKLKQLFAGQLLAFLGWFLFLKTFQVFLTEVCGCVSWQIFEIYFLYGVWLTLSQVAFIAVGRTYYASKMIFSLSLFFLAFCLLALFFAASYTAVVYILPFLILGYAVFTPSLSYRISQEAKEQELGKIMGLHQSVQSLAKMMAPLVSGGLLVYSTPAPLIAAFILIFSGGIFFTFIEYKQKKSVLMNQNFQ